MGFCFCICWISVFRCPFYIILRSVVCWLICKLINITAVGLNSIESASLQVYCRYNVDRKTGAHAHKNRMKRVIIVYIYSFLIATAYGPQLQTQQVLNCATKYDFVHLHTYSVLFFFFFRCLAFSLFCASWKRIKRILYIFKWALKRMPAAFGGMLVTLHPMMIYALFACHLMT